MGSPPLSPERLCDVARCDNLPVEQAIEQFPYEQTITIVATKPVARPDAIDLSHALDMFPSERNLLVIVPAGQPVAYEAPRQHGTHRAARVGWAHGMRDIVVAIAAMAVRVLSRMLWPIRLARRVLAAIWRGALDVPGRLRSAAGRFANQAIGVVRSAGRIAIDRCRMLRSRAASLVVGAHQAVGIRVARALALPARLSFDLRRALQAMRGSIDIRLDIARRLAQPLTLRKPTARMTQAWKALGHRSLALGRVAVSTAQRFAVAAVRHVSRPALQDVSPGRSRAPTARGVRGWVGRPDKTNTVPSEAALQLARLVGLRRASLEVPLRLRSAAGRFANQAMGVVRSAGRIAIDRCRMLRSRAASLVVGAHQAVGIRVARALALPARLSFDLRRALQAMRGSIDIRLDIARRLAQPLTLRKPTARMTQAWKALGHRSLALGRVAVSTAQRFAVAAVRHVSRPALQDVSPGRSRAPTARGVRGWVGRPDKTNTVPSEAALQLARLVGLRRASLEVPLRLRSAAGRFANQAMGVVRSAGRIAIDRCRMLRSRSASLAVGARRAVGIRVARALALPARLSIDLRRALQSMRGSIGIRLDLARRSVQALTLRKPTARMTQAWKPSGHRSLGPGRVAVSTAQRVAVAAVIFTVIVTAMFAISGWDVPRAMAPGATRPAAAVSLPPSNDPIAANATDRPSPNPPRSEPRPTADPAPPVRRQPPPPVASTAAIQRVLNRYRDAHSTLDVSAVTAAWPSVDTAALRRSFARLAEHNVEYESCRVSVADTRASAVCRGVTQSVRVGERTTTQESQQWQFVLDQVGDRWLITAVDSR